MKKDFPRKFGLLVLSLILTFNLSLIFIGKPTFKDETGFFQYNDSDELNELRLSSSKTNGKPLLVQQLANITSGPFQKSSGENVSFSLNQDWISKNVTINYEGISKKKEWIYNGDLYSNRSGWTYDEVDTNNRLDELPYIDWDGNPAGCIGIGVSQGDYYEGDKAYYYQNITIPEGLAAKNAKLYLDYKYLNSLLYPTNASIYMGVIIGGVEKNKTIDMQDIALDQWNSDSMSYDPVSFGQVLPGVVTIRVGISIDADCTKGGGGSTLRLDSIKFELWTEPNEPGILRAYDTEFSQDHTFINTTYGEGYSFIDVVRTRNQTYEVIFTIFENITDTILDFTIDSISIYSRGVKEFNTTFSSETGSYYILGQDITWQLSFDIFVPSSYICWVHIDKPPDWVFTSILDGGGQEKIGSCIGTGIGSVELEIPSSSLQLGYAIWNMEAVSQSYLEDGILAVWNGSQFMNTTELTFGDIFHVNISINETVSLSNTLLNFTIYNPDDIQFYHESREPTSYNEKFGNFTVGENMTAGKYQARIQWVNNISYLGIDQVGYIELDFIVWHHTNLSATESYIEKIEGDPCLIKVNYTDIDFDTYIDFASVSYNSTFGQSGSMVYLGSGIYFLDLDTSSLGLGDYYFSFNASKIFYQNQTAIDLIQLKIVSQPLAIELPDSVISGIANSYVSCQINVTGALSRTLIWPANVSTSWQNLYDVTNHNNGTYSLNFSTVGLPEKGIIETYAVSIYVNKTGHGSTSSFITITIFPIQTTINVNKSLNHATINEIVYIKINYTIESSSMLILGANYTVVWPSLFNIIPDTQGITLQLNTIDLSVDTYTATIKAEKVGYETAFTTVTIIVDYIAFNITSVNFQDSIDLIKGETRTLEIKLTDPLTGANIDDASVVYDWEFGIGYFEFVGDGVYQLELEAPPNIEGNFKMTLTVSKEDSIYKRTEFSFIIDIYSQTQSNNIPWYILITLISIIGILGAVSLRTYVYKPIKVKKKNELLANTQRYKDIMNIETILVSNRRSGIHIYSKSYDILKNYQNELLSGFIQAITLISNEIVGKEKPEQITIKSDKIKGKEKIIELDFKHFNFFISDYKELRIVFILKEKASERFKTKTAEFLSEIDQLTARKFQKWDGELKFFNKIIPSLLEKHFDVYYREKFIVNPVNNVSRVAKEAEFNKITTRLLNVILSMTRLQPEFYLEDAIKTIQVKNRDKVIEGLEKIIERQIIMPAKRL
ncbi:MAG: hypothetical protein ACFFE4_10400 [Candidatus Thorarchaeota archaeon]